MTPAAPPIRVVIIDDEPVARRRLRDLVAVRPDLTLVAECSSRAEALAAMASDQPELIFLDIRLPDGSGFDILEQVGGATPTAVVFVTAYDQYALRAFEAHALDYLLKPFDDERFTACVDRVVGLLSTGARWRAQELGQSLRRQLADQPQPARLAIRGTGRTLFVDVEEIRWVEAADYCVQLHLGGGSQLMRTSLQQLERRLDPARFVRVHRSAIVAIAWLRELRPTLRGDAVAVLTDGTRIRVSRRYRAALAARLDG